MSRLFGRSKNGRSGNGRSRDADKYPLNERDASEAGARLRESLTSDGGSGDGRTNAAEDGAEGGRYRAAPRTLRGGDFVDRPTSERRSPLQQSKEFSGSGGRKDWLPNAILIVVLVSMVYLVAGTIFVGGSSSEDAAAGSGGLSAAERQASSLAQGFASSYLTLGFTDNSDTIATRIGPFLADDIDETLVTPNFEGTASRRVLSADAVDVRPLSENKYEVKVQASVAVATEESLSDAGVSVEDLGSESVSTSSGGDSDGAGSSGSAAGAAPTIPAGAETVERMDMLVQVGVGEDGSASVVAPPTLTEPSSRFSGETGAISGPNAQTLDDGPILELLQGYLASAYGSQDSRGSLQNYLAEGGQMPPMPSTDLDFLGLEAGTGYIYPVDLEKASGLDRFSRVYDVEAHAEVEDPSTGTSYYQTQLLRVGETGGEWKIIGPVPDGRRAN